MQTSGDRKPEPNESYFAGVSEPPFLHGCDSSQAESALGTSRAMTVGSRPYLAQLLAPARPHVHKRPDHRSLTAEGPVITVQVDARRGFRHIRSRAVKG